MIITTLRTWTTTPNTNWKTRKCFRKYWKSWYFPPCLGGMEPRLKVEPRTEFPQTCCGLTRKDPAAVAPDRNSTKAYVHLLCIYKTGTDWLESWSRVGAVFCCIFFAVFFLLFGITGVLCSIASSYLREIIASLFFLSSSTYIINQSIYLQCEGNIHPFHSRILCYLRNNRLRGWTNTTRATSW